MAGAEDVVVVVVVEGAAASPSHAVVSTMKLPFLSWHLLQFNRQSISATSTPQLPANRLLSPTRPFSLTRHESLHSAISPSKQPLHRPAPRDTVAPLRGLNFTAVLHHFQQFAGTQVNRLASLRLSLLSIDIDLDLRRQLRRRKAVAGRRHCGISRGGFHFKSGAARCPKPQQGAGCSVRLKRPVLTR